MLGRQGPGRPVYGGIHGEPRERRTTSPRPRLWPYLQGIAGVAVLFGIIETVFVHFFVTAHIGRVGGYLQLLTTGCFWDGIVVSGSVGFCFLPLQYFVTTKSQQACRILGIFIATTLFSTGLMLVSTGAKVMSWMTIMFMDEKSCTFFRYSLTMNNPGTCYSRCVSSGVPDVAEACCCCSSFSLADSNVTIVTNVDNCSALFSLPAIYYGAAACCSLVLLVVCTIVLLLLISMACSCCGAKLTSSSRLSDGVTSPLLGADPPNYSSVVTTSPLDSRVQHAPSHSYPVSHPERADTFSFDRGPPPAYHAVVR